MLELSRDWRESITLSSRDPHLGQRIVFGGVIITLDVVVSTARRSFRRPILSSRGRRSAPRDSHPESASRRRDVCVARIVGPGFTAQRATTRVTPSPRERSFAVF